MNKAHQSIIDLKQIKKIVQLTLNNWYVIIGMLVLASGACYFYLSSQKKLFSAQVGVSLIDKGQKYLNYSQDEAIAFNSPELVEKTIESLQMDVSYYHKSGKTNTELFKQLPFQVTIGIVDKGLYEKEIQIEVLNNSQFELSYEFSGKIIKQNGYFDSIVSTPELRIEILKKFNAIPCDSISSCEYVITIHNKADLVAKCQSAIKVSLANDINQMRVEYEDFIPEKALAFLDVLSKKYLENNIQSQVEKNGKLINGVNSMLFKTEKVMKDLQDSIAINSRNAKIEMGIDDSQPLSLSTNSILDVKKLEYYLINITEIENYLLVNSDPGIPPPYFDETLDRFLKNSLTELYQIQLTKKDYLITATMKTIEMASLDQKYEIRKNNILNYLKNTRETVEKKIKNAQKLVNATKLNINEGYMSELLGKLKVNEAMYVDLLGERNELTLAQASVDSAYKIYEAVNLVPPTPNSKTIFLFLGVGVIFAIIFIFLKNLFYEKIESIEDLGELISTIPILGELTDIEFVSKLDNSILKLDMHPLPYSLLRGIRTNIDFILSNKSTKKILITSHSPNEGKTLMTVNIAAILAIANKKVLILDMDLHKPNIHKTLGLNSENVLGITDVLRKKCNIQDVVIKTLVPNLDVIQAGTVDINGSELLLGDITKTIFDYGNKYYDYIIIDTPPVGLISDGLTLMKYTDMNIYVVNSLIPYKNSIAQANEITVKNKFKLYFILNRVKNKKLQYYSKNYSSYKYAYAS